MRYNALTPAGGAVMLFTMLVSAVSGLRLIPLFRLYKTGMYEPRIGDRMRKDISSPRFGGALSALGLTVSSLISAAVLLKTADISGADAAGEYTAAVGFVLLTFALGFAQDYIKQKLRRPAGIKAKYRFLYLWALSAAFLVIIHFISANDTAVLLPFRWGYLELSLAYYPLVSLIMAAVICAFCVHDTFGGEEDNCCDGLLCVTTLLLSLFFAVMSEGGCSLLGYASAGAQAGLLLWTLYPAKIYQGESGQLLCGAVFCAMCIISGTELLLIILPLSVIMEFTAAAVRYFYFRKTKRVLLMGGTLHSHLKKKGFSDIAVIMFSLPVTVLGIVFGVMFVLYSLKL